MPVVRTEYAPGFEVPDCVPLDLGATLSCPVYRNDAIVVVTQAGSTFSLRKPDGTLLVDAAAVVVGGDGIPTYALSAGALADESYGVGYRAEWKLVIAGVTHTFRNEVYLVRYAPTLPISDRDLTGRHAKIDTWLAGTGKSTWQDWIETTWFECQRWLIGKGNRPHLIVQSTDIKDLMRVWTMKNVLADVMSSQNGPQYRELYADYRDQLEHLLSTTSFAYAPADDTTPARRRRPASPVTFLGTNGWLDAGRGYGFDRDPEMP
jgi:hypothetical protein